MPTYDYRCKNCDSFFSIDKSMNDPHPENCPSCSDTDINRLWDNIQLKGEEKGSGGKNCGGSCSGNCGSCGCG